MTVVLILAFVVMFIAVLLIAIVIILGVNRGAVEQHEQRRDAYSHPPASLHSQYLQSA